MSDETTVKEPRTEAGRTLLRALRFADADLRTSRDDIAAIEDEARSAVLAEVRAAVEGLPAERIEPQGPIGGYDHRDGAFLAPVVGRAAVLALIDHISEGK